MSPSVESVTENDGVIAALGQYAVDVRPRPAHVQADMEGLESSAVQATPQVGFHKLI